jgi:hypothetical protein
MEPSTPVSPSTPKVTIEEPVPATPSSGNTGSTPFSPASTGSGSASASSKFDRPSRGLSKTYSRESLTRQGSIHALPDDLQVTGSSHGDSAHSFSPAEKIGFSQHINQCFEYVSCLSEDT